MSGIAVGAAFIAGIAFGPRAAVVALAALVATMARRRDLAPILCVVTLAAMAGALRGAEPPRAATPPWIDEASAFRGVVASGPLDAGGAQRFDLALTAVRIGDEWRDAGDRICVTAPVLPEVRLRDRLQVTGAAVAARDWRPSFAAYLGARGCVATVQAESAAIVARGGGWQRALDGVRQALTRRLQAVAPGDAGALLAGLLTGDDAALSSARRAAFVATGTTHITAVSGSNLALIVVIATTLGTAAGVRRRLGWQAATVLGVWGYAVMVGLGPPALRAALVAIGAVLAPRFGRRPDYVTLTLLAAMVELAVRPEDFWLLSFRLSLVSSLALALVVPGLEPAGLRGWTAAAVVGTTAAQVGTLPVLIAAFGRVATLSLPANLLIAPAVAVAFPLAALAAVAGTAIPDLGYVLAVPAVLLADYIIAVVDGLTRLGLAEVTVGPVNAAANALVTAAAIGGVAALSRDCRLAIRRLWR